MAGLLSLDPSHYRMAECVPYNLSYSKFEEHDSSGATWYFSRREIEENSPSRRDGLDLKKEAYLRKSYCTFLQDLGMRLKVPQVTIATAIIFCHRFFLHQSHGKNDRRTIATVCMFLAGKVEETPRPLKDVIIVSYEITHKKDPVAVQRIKQREVYEQQKELVLLGERVVLTTVGFDLNVHHPYKPLVEAIKKFKVAQNALAQVAWNFVNDGLRTSLCLQFKPHHIAAGAIFLAAKFLKVTLPSDGEKVWWQEFDVTPHQLEEVSNQMLELYEQNHAPASDGTETEGTSAGGSNYRGPVKSQASFDESSSQNRYSQALGTAAAKQKNPTSSRPLADQSHTDKCKERMIKNEDHGDKEPRGGSWDHDADSGKDLWCHGSGNKSESLNNKANYVSEKPTEGHGQPKPGGKSEKKECNPRQCEGLKGYSSKDTIKKIDKDKVKAALEKQRKSCGDISRKVGFTDKDDFIARELESGVELAVEDERAKQERKQSWSKNLDGRETVSSGYGTGNGNPVSNPNKESAEEGELPFGTDYHSPENGSRKRKAPSPSRHIEGKERYDLPRHYSSAYLKYRGEDGCSMGRYDQMERDNKRYG